MRKFGFAPIKEAKIIKTKETLQERWVRFRLEVKRWENKCAEYGIEIKHPDWFETDEKYILDIDGAKELRFAEPDKDNKAPHYLVMREAMRRHYRGKSTPWNNYIKLLVRSFERMTDELLDENSKELGDTYNARPNSNSSRYMEFDGKKQFGETNSKGWFWSPTFRRYYPHEQFILIGRIDRLYTEWGQGSYKRGMDLKEKGLGDPATIRKEWKESGYAAEMILKYKLPVDKFMGKLIDGYIPRKKETDNNQKTLF